MNFDIATGVQFFLSRGVGRQFGTITIASHLFTLKCSRTERVVPLRRIMPSRKRARDTHWERLDWRREDATCATCRFVKSYNTLFLFIENDVSRMSRVPVCVLWPHVAPADPMWHPMQAPCSPFWHPMRALCDPCGGPCKPWVAPVHTADDP